MNQNTLDYSNYVIKLLNTPIKTELAFIVHRDVNADIGTI